MKKTYPYERFKFENRPAREGDIYFHVFRKVRFPFFPTYCFVYKLVDNKWGLIEKSTADYFSRGGSWHVNGVDE